MPRAMVQKTASPMVTQIEVGRLAELMVWVRQRNGAVCVFMETPHGSAPGFTVQANADGPKPDSFEYLESEIAGNDLPGCVAEVLEELQAQEKADAA
jgi:hypothetical protein